MRTINITAVAPNGEVWDLEINPESTRQSLIEELIETMTLDAGRTYNFRGNPQFPLSNGAIVVLDESVPKNVINAFKRGR